MRGGEDGGADPYIERPDERPIGGGMVVDEPEVAEEDDGTRLPCPDCGRKFRPSALARHRGVCKKVFVNKRKAFDSKATRVSTEAVSAGASGGGGGRSRPGRGRGRGRGAATASAGPDAAAAAAKKKAWKAKSSQLRDAMKASRMITQAEKAGIDIRDLPPMPVSAPAVDMVSCPHCGRSFNETAAERHIPKCKTTQARPKRLIKGSGTGAWRRR
jgi:endogenous inhibitor of DNA gyrase (YacG/DUF329 family)